MDIRLIGPAQLQEAIELYITCCIDSPVYAREYKDFQTRGEFLREQCAHMFEVLLSGEKDWGVYFGNELVGLLLTRELHDLYAQNPEVLTQFQDSQKFMDRWLPLKGKVIYISFCIEHPNYRHLRICEYLMREVTKAYKDTYIVIDEEMPEYLNIYRQLGYLIEEVIPRYYSCVRIPEFGRMRVMLPHIGWDQQIQEFKESFLGQEDGIIRGGRHLESVFDSVEWCSSLNRNKRAVTVLCMTPDYRQIVAVFTLTLSQAAPTAELEFSISPAHRNAYSDGEVISLARAVAGTRLLTHLTVHYPDRDDETVEV